MILSSLTKFIPNGYSSDVILPFPPFSKPIHHRQALSLLPLCKHLGMDSSLSSSGRSLWALPRCCDRGELGCWTWTRLCSFRTGPAGGGGEEGPPPTDFLTLSSLSPPYSTTWPLPHLLLLQPSYARPSYARSWSPIYHLRL